MTNALKELLPSAAESQVTLALEPMHAQCAREWTFLTSVGDAVKVIREMEHPQLKLAFDTYCFGLDEQVVKTLPALVPQLAVVQLGDARQGPDGDQERCPLGAGVIPLERIVLSLLEAGYAGYFDIKLMGQEIETANYYELLQTSRDTVARLGNAEV